MATIRKRGTKWQVQVRREGFKPVSKSFTLKSDAEEWARLKENQADRRDFKFDLKKLDQISWGELLVRYRDTIVTQKKSCASETAHINAYLKREVKTANLKLSQIEPYHFSEYRDKRLKTVKPSTLCREFGIFHNAFEIARTEWGIPVPINPISVINKPKASKGRDRRLEPHELEAICKAAKATHNVLILPIILFALETGMRRGEILAMRWVDIDFNVRTLSIPITKNGHSRTIPLTGEAVRILQEVRNEDIKVFPITANSLRMAWDRLVIRAKIEDLHFHDLRHEAISRFFEKGLSVPEVALISGHRDFRMLFRYTHLRAEDLVRKLN
jgi:integrase